MARKEAKRSIQTDITTIHRYHGGHFLTVLYFTSDRYIILTSDFKRPDGKPLLGFGLEVETECTGISKDAVLAEVFNKIIFAKFPENLWKLEHDISLRGGSSSAECITQIMTRDRIRNLYPQFKAMFNDYFPSFGISASRTGNCGMHVNISNGNFGRKPEIIDESIKKLLYFVNHHYDVCLILFKRRADKTEYCLKMPEYDDKEACKNADLYNMSPSHHNCFNASHYPQGRIELRLVGGQPDYFAFRNTMETVFFLVDRMHSLKWDDLDDLYKVFQGCNQYVLKRLTDVCMAGLMSPRRVQDEITPTIKQEQFL